MANDLGKLTTEIVEACAICRHSKVVRDRQFEQWLFLIEPFGVNKCRSCSLKWLSPRPTQDSYRIVYSDEHYFTSEAGSNVSYVNFVSQRKLHFKNRLQKIQDCFNGKPLKILDYGAATGEFVAMAIAEGHECIGVELSDDARQTAKLKNNIELLSPEQLAGGTFRFDVVHMNHVFEHVSDPAGHLAWCRAQMASNGLLVIEVPQQFCNHIDRLKRLLGRGGKFAGFGAFSLHHTYFFSARNLKELIENNGFEVLHLTTDVSSTRLGAKKTPKTTLIRFGSWAANLMFKGGDNIEVFARAK